MDGCKLNLQFCHWDSLKSRLDFNDLEHVFKVNKRLRMLGLGEMNIVSAENKFLDTAIMLGHDGDTLYPEYACSPG